MTSPTRERSPLRVYRYGTVHAGYPWAWVCRKCDESQISYTAHWRALRDALDHWNDCPALRLARLEAELEKLRDAHAGFRRGGRPDGSIDTNGGWVRQAEVTAELTAILARHRQASA